MTRINDRQNPFWKANPESNALDKWLPICNLFIINSEKNYVLFLSGGEQSFFFIP